MIERTPEPEVMDDEARAKAYADADFSEVDQAFVDALLKTFPEAASARILDLGCGPAQIPIRLAKAAPEALITAVDASKPMLDLGRRAVLKSGVGGRVLLHEGHIPGLALPARSFGAVVSNSLLHHLGRPEDLFEEVLRLGRPGAPVFVMDLRRPDSEEEAQQIVDESDESESPLLKEDFYASLLAAYTPEEVSDQLRTAGFEDAKAEAVGERHLAVLTRVPEA